MTRSLGGVVCLAAVLAARALGSGPAEPAVADGGPRLFFLEHADVSPPLAQMPVIAPREGKRRLHQVKLLRPPQPGAEAVADPVRQTRVATPRVAARLGASFDGLGVGLGSFKPNSAPPDTSGAVGAGQYVQWVNTSFAVFDKASGAPVFGPADGNTLWQGFGGPCQDGNDGDPIVAYDRAAERWVMTQFAVSTGQFFQCVAVSTTADAAGAYRRFAYQFDALNDYPKMGVWPDGYYFSFNMFNATGPLGSRVCAADRLRMITPSATPGPLQCFQTARSFAGLLPADLDGAAPPPADAAHYSLSYGPNELQLWKLRVDWTAPSTSTFTGPIPIPVAAFGAACGGDRCIPQPETSQTLDALSDRLMHRLAYRNLGSHEALVVNHSVAAGAAASGLRWYEIRSPGGTPSLHQQGTYAPDATSRWMGSASMDKDGNIALAYSASGGGVRPSVRFTGRTPGDAPGTLQGEATIVAGGGSQTGGLARWGDYSTLSLDPTDDCTFWFTTEYLKASGSFNWSTRIASFRFPSCDGAPPAPGFALAVAPAALSVPRGGSGRATISVASLGGFSSAVELRASALPAGVSATVEPATVTPPAGGSAEATLVLAAGQAAAVGTFTVPVTAAAGALSRDAGVALTVGPLAVFSDGAESLSTSLTLTHTAASTRWTRSGATPFAGGFAWKAGSPGGGNYGGNGDARMTTPALDLRGAATAALHYAYRHRTEANVDVFQVRVSTDGGSNWTTLASASGQSPAWPGFSTKTIDLTAYAGKPNVRLQFRLATNPTRSDFGVAVDEIEVVKE